jgi:hypothetical protein
VPAKDKSSGPAEEEGLRQKSTADNLPVGSENTDVPRTRGGNADLEDLPHAPTTTPERRDHRVSPQGQEPEPQELPLLLVDIDGVISLFSFEPGAQPRGMFHSIDGIPHFLSSGAAEHLLVLARIFDLVWASGWEEKANEYLPHLLGLPRLSHLSFERPAQTTRRTSAHWKLEAIDAYAGDARALAWIDDAFNEACHTWARARIGPTLLVQTSPASGLTQREAEILASWAEGLEPADSEPRVR